MLNINNIGLMLYQTVQVATLDCITQINFFTSQVSPPHARSRWWHLCVCSTVVGAIAHCSNVYKQGKNAACFVVL